MLKTPAALYIHWPFCKKKCPYCDFNSHVREGIDHARWRNALLAELHYWHQRTPGFTLSSIFFGGGTPTLMEPQTVAALIAQAGELWGLTPDCEITLEANPTSVEAAKFRDLRTAGVNRLSLGVQSFNPAALAFLGREHSADEARKAIALAADTFERYSFDLIYALPNQTAKEWEAELTAAIPLARGHLSLYQLTIEENTAFHHAYHVAHAFHLPEDSLAAELFERTQQIMEAAGMPAYEISNHAKPGQESRHNLTYWRSGPYIGIGPGAHGRVDLLSSPPEGERALPGTAAAVPWGGRLATRTLKSPENWLSAVENNGHGLEEEITLTLAERAEEIILMGLRLREGISLATLPPEILAELTRRGIDARIHHLTQQGLLTTGPTLRTTPRGQLLLNHVIAELLKTDD